MKPDRGKLLQQLETYQNKLIELESFIKELNRMVEIHGTDYYAFGDDLVTAERNAQYYSGEIARLRGEIDEDSESD